VKIDGKLTTPLTGDVSGDLRTGKPATPAKGEAGQGQNVDVQISSLAEQLRAIQARLASGEVVDAAKVAEIRQAIAEGRFQVNPDAIAERLLQTVRELLEGYRKA
jgi:negative regulator of flagellin synthesis FlgM